MTKDSQLDQWVQSLPFQKTSEGVRLDLRVYVYPNGMGNFHTAGDTGKGRVFANVEQAERVLRRIWEYAQTITTKRTQP